MQWTPGGIILALIAAAVVGYGWAHRNDPPEPGCHWRDGGYVNSTSFHTWREYVCDGTVVATEE